jgi:hypothetical protein
MKVYPRSRGTFPPTEAKEPLGSETFIWNVNTLIFRQTKFKQLHIHFIISRCFLITKIDDDVSGILYGISISPKLFPQPKPFGSENFDDTPKENTENNAKYIKGSFVM